MNIIRMTGGLGNQMFEYALFLKYKSMGIESSFEDFTEYEGHDNRRPILLNEAFGIEYPKASRKEYYSMTDRSPSFFSKVRRKLFGAKASVYEESTADFDAHIFDLDNTYICGYFQSDRYFDDIKEKVSEAYSFRDEVKARAEDILKNALDNSGNVSEDELDELFGKSVSIHIRRGDYLDNEGNYGNICTDEYYDKAVRYFADRNPEYVFLVFSNDAEWTDKWILDYQAKGIKMINVVGTTEDTGYYDMYLMSRCDHNIIANSSFSWWAAYLNANPEKKVIAPPKWTNHLLQKDIYTKDMIVL